MNHQLVTISRERFDTTMRGRALTRDYESENLDDGRRSLWQEDFGAANYLSSMVCRKPNHAPEALG